MYLQINDIKKYIGYSLKIANKDKSGWIHSVFVRGYCVENERTYVLLEVIGHNDILYGAKLKVELSSIIDYLYYDDGRDLDYYGEYSEEIIESDLKSDILDEQYAQWCDEMECRNAI